MIYLHLVEPSFWREDGGDKDVSQEHAEEAMVLTSGIVPAARHWNDVVGDMLGVVKPMAVLSGIRGLGVRVVMSVEVSGM